MTECGDQADGFWGEVELGGGNFFDDGEVMFLGKEFDGIGGEMQTATSGAIGRGDNCGEGVVLGVKLREKFFHDGDGERGGAEEDKGSHLTILAGKASMTVVYGVGDVEAVSE